jgi:hypothetical protein
MNPHPIRKSPPYELNSYVRVLYFCREETWNRDTFIDLFPMNPNTGADKSPVGSLCGG